MQLSRASRHVLQALVHLARERPGVWVAAEEIERKVGLPDKFLRMLLGRLVKGPRGPLGEGGERWLQPGPPGEGHHLA